MTPSPRADAIHLLLEHVSGYDEARVIDIGCGAGLLAKRLTAAGARVMGVDPDETALAAARITAPSATFHCARAERLPFADGSFDFAVFLNSLHHVAPAAMFEALTEARRVLSDDGHLFVIEPCATGSLFEVLKIIDDETIVRRHAQDAIGRMVHCGAVRMKQSLSYDRRERFADLDTFIDRIAAVEPHRRQAADARREELSRLFLQHSVAGDDGGRVLAQPMTACVLAKAQDNVAEGGAK